jgi:hypothetical protein
VYRFRPATNLKYKELNTALAGAAATVKGGTVKRNYLQEELSMETSAAKQAREKSVNPAALSTPERHLPQGSAPDVRTAAENKLVGYGLPCSHCHAYYPADMQACPICKSPDRVSPNGPVATSIAATVPQPASQPALQTMAGPQFDGERERLLKELKSQAFASHTQINAAATFRCVLAHQHSGATEPAAVCHSCYGEVRQQADRMEAALHMDAREAAKIVYEAVWADTSDPNVTYLNAATALLSELRKRAGIGLLLGAHQPLAH